MKINTQRSHFELIYLFLGRGLSAGRFSLFEVAWKVVNRDLAEAKCSRSVIISLEPSGYKTIILPSCVHELAGVNKARASVNICCRDGINDSVIRVRVPLRPFFFVQTS